MRNKKDIGFFISKDDTYFLSRTCAWSIEFADRIKLKLFGPFVEKLYKYGIGPSTLTMFGFLSAILANILLFTHEAYFVAFILLYLFFDMLDGTSSKRNNCQTVWGNGLDEAVDLAIALVTTIVVGIFINQLLLASLSMVFLFFQEWLYGLLYRIGIRKVPVQSFYASYFIMFFKYYIIAFYFNIVLSILGSLIGVYFFLNSRGAKK